MSRTARPAQGKTPALRIYQGGFKRWVMFLASVGLLFFGGRLAYLPFTDSGVENPVLHFVLGVVILLVCVAVIYYTRPSLGKPKPSLILTPKGIRINQRSRFDGFIPWSQVTGCAMIRSGGKRFIGLELKSPDIYIKSGNFLDRFTRRANFKSHGAPVFIITDLLKYDHDKLLGKIQQLIDLYGAAKSGERS